MDSQLGPKQPNHQYKRKANKLTLRIFWGIILLIIIVAVAGSANNKKPAKTNLTVSTVKSSTTKPTSSSNTVATPATTSPEQSDTSSIPATTAAPAPSTPSCWTASQAINEEGESGCVQFVGYAYTSSRGEMYLDESLSPPYGFSAYIPAGSSFGESVISQYSGQSVDVTGTITSYEGEPEIVVTSASQIQPAN